MKVPLLDLHGVKVEDVPNRLDRFLVDCTRRGHPRCLVMPGKGTGKVKSAVIEYLRLGKFPWHYSKDAGGKKNEGVLLVILE